MAETPDTQGEGAASAGRILARPKSPRLESQVDKPHWQQLACQADLLASRGRYADALQLVDKALSLEPGRADLHLGRGQCLAHLKRFDEALESFERTSQLEPSHPFLRSNKAAVLLKQENWEGAAAVLRDAMRDEPQNADLKLELAKALTEQGVRIKTGGGGTGDPKQLFNEALVASEAYAPAYFQLGVEFSEARDDSRAKDMYTKAVQIQPRYVEAWNNLGVACRNLREPHHAVEAYQMALKTNPNCEKTRENVAICFLEMGLQALREKDTKKAIAAMKRALTYNSQSADVYFNLGVAYAETEKFDRARVHYELATHFDPQHVNAHNNLGVIHRRQGNMEAAVQCFERALALEPNMALSNKNLGAIFGAMGRMAESIRLTRVALECQGDDPEACNNLALLYRDQGDVETCLEYLDLCLKSQPKNMHAGSNRLMTILYLSNLSREEVFEAHRSWGQGVECKVAQRFTSWSRSVSTSRPLRIGYISPDFYHHSVSYFIHAALKHHDPAVVHVTCYSDVATEDDKTQLFKSFATAWRHTLGRSDEDVACLIHEDAIDILVDLTGHTGNNRLAVFAQKPAPIQITWIGYPHTTGLSRMDYRIGDEHSDPPKCPGLTTESMAYLPECFLCYTPSDHAPGVALRPASEAYGCPTFGCFNNLAKVSPLTLRLFCRVLQEVPESRLFLKSKALLCSEVQEKFRSAFALNGIDAHRVDLSGLQPATGNHLQMYNLIDVALDTAPYAGTTTTCEALYMGVPVVTLGGQGVHAQNVGVSLLSAVNLRDDCVAFTEDEYVGKATVLCRNGTRLAALRAGLRQRMLKSVLCDGPRHAARLERLYVGLAAGARAADSQRDAPEAQ